MVYSTGPSWAKTFSVVRDFILGSNKTTISPVVPLESYASKQEVVTVLKEKCRGTSDRTEYVARPMLKFNEAFVCMYGRWG